jgi:hypothetical protein
VALLLSVWFVLILAGLAFGGSMALIGFGGFLTAWFHASLGTPLPLPTIHSPFEKKLYLCVGFAGFLLWGGAFLASLHVAP